MSGFIGILDLDGAPVDRALLERMTQALAFRGPDAQEIWNDGLVGLGHALLHFAHGSPMERQPAHLDGRLSVIADARIDARAELIEKLKTKSQSAERLSLSTPDAELILDAYDAWGECCVEHLLGDFSFAIWDRQRRRLFCARDQMGVKLFYYAHIGSLFIFSNTLDCIRMHPAVSSRLNELAIADFLLFDANQDPATTSFADIQRLPPAHILACEQGKISTRRYWELSVTTPIHYARDQEYVERFQELLDAAVADRLRTSSAGVMMSGGLDSPTVAASAHRLLSAKRCGTGISAYTVVFDQLIHDEEREYAGLVANALNIPIEYLTADECEVFELAKRVEYHSPEPMHSAWPDRTTEYWRKATLRKIRVILTGYGADPGFSSRITIHFRQLLEKKQLGRAVADAARYLTTEGRLSRLYLRKRLGILFAPRRFALGYPVWLNEDLERRLDLRGRWESSHRGSDPVAGNAVRPEAHALMAAPYWPNLFEGYDADSTGVPMEVRFPFFDLRLVKFMLGLPRLPWCSDKQMLREAGRGVLPETVRLRRKSPLRSDPMIPLLSRAESAWVDRFEPVPELEPFVIRNRIPTVHKETNSSSAWIHLRPLSLNFWLRQNTRWGKKLNVGDHHE